jgi:signal transduction histidine kinase
MEAVASEIPEIAQRQEPSVWRLLASVSESPTQNEAEAGLRSVLDDPTLELLVWVATEQAYVGADGSRPDLSAGRNGDRAVTILPHSEQPVGALVHDPRLLDVPAFHDVVAAASLAIRKDRLAEELHARIDELRRREEEVRESRRRLVEAGDAARQRLERNLHDGAQQRLVSLSLSLRLAQARLQTSPEAASEILTGASKELAVALEELRQLARGLHPAVLTERGLSAAIDSLRDSAAIDVRVDAVPSERLPEPVEAAAYYIVVEALTNAARYAGAAEARVGVTVEAGVAHVEVADDGIGGANPAGSGLRGLADRAEALGGTLVVESPPGRGTVVRASIPLAD